MSNSKREYLKCGYLYKKGHIIKNWKRRYVVLTTNELSYFKDENTDSKQKSISLEEIEKIEKSDVEDGHNNIMVITTNSNKFYFSCESTNERESWKNSILDSISNSVIISKPISSKILYTRYNHKETMEERNLYFNRLVTKFCEAKSINAYLDSLLCLTAYIARIYSDHMNVNIDGELFLSKCDNLLEMVNKQRDEGKKYVRWDDRVEYVYFDFIEMITALQNKLRNIIEINNAITLGTERAKSSHNTSPILTSERPNSISPKTGIFKLYRLEKQIGAGGYSIVQKAINIKTNEHVAIKCINKSKLTEKEIRHLQSEVEVMSRLDHPNIIKLIDFYEEDDMYYIVLEYADGGVLFDKIIEKKYYTETEARSVIKSIIKAIAYFHERNIVHRDLKPENILFSSSGDIKIADFGFARSIEECSRLRTDCGTSWFMAPEILDNKSYGNEVDMWSLGVIIYIILSGCPPFHDNNQERLFCKIRTGRYAFRSEIWNNISDDAKDLIKHLLVVDPRYRYDAKQVLNSKWLTSERVGSQTHLNIVQEGLKRMTDIGRKTILKQGYLMKQGHIIKNWKKRSFVLTVNSLAYYADETSTSPKGEIELSDIISVSNTKKTTNFIIKTKSGKSLEIEAKDEKEKNIWKTSLLSARRCWLLVERSAIAKTEERIDDAIIMLSEARRCEGMLVNEKLLNCWAELSKKCEKYNCAGVYISKTYNKINSLEIFCVTTIKDEKTSYLLLGSSNGIIQVYNMDDMSYSQLSVGDNIGITSLSVQHSKELFLSTCSNGKIQFWSFPQRKVLNNSVCHSCSISCSDFSRTKPVVVVGTIDGCIKTFNSDDFRTINNFKCHTGRICDISFDFTSQYIVSAGENGELMVMDALKLTLIKKMEDHIGTVKSISINFDDLMLSIGDDNKVILWDLNQLKKRKELSTERIDTDMYKSNGKTIGVSLSNDSRWGLTVDSHSQMILWNINDGLPEVLNSIEDQIKNIMFLSDNTGFIIFTNSKVEKWIFDWMLSYDGRKYDSPVGILVR